MEQVVVRELQQRKGVVAVRRSLEIITYRPAERDQLEELRPVHQIDAQLERCTGRIAAAFGDKPRQQQPLHIQRSVQAEFVRIEQRRFGAARVFIAGFPFVVAVQPQREYLAAPEQVVVADFEGQSRAQEAVRLRSDVHLQFRFERIIESGRQIDVQRIFAVQRVQRRDAEVHRTENAEFIQVGQRRILSVHRKQVARFHRNGFRQQLRPDLQRFLVNDRLAGQVQRVGRSAADILQRYGDASHPVRNQRRGRNPGSQPHPQIDAVFLLRRIGLIIDVFRSEIIITTISQHVRNPGSFGRQRIGIVLRAHA